MATQFHLNVNLKGYRLEESLLTFKLASGITANHVGRAVSVDATAANTVKLAASGDVVFGRLAVVEDRGTIGGLLGTVELKFANTLPIKSGETVIVGDTVVGAGSGEVKALANAVYKNNTVVEVVSGFATVIQI